MTHAVTSLLLKPTRGKPLVRVASFEFDKIGIAGNAICPPLRQVLLLPSSVLREFRLSPGDLRENIVVDYASLHELSSGTVIRLGAARIRLTFHCEPCSRIGDVVNIKRIAHRRGYLGCFLNAGTLRVGDSLDPIGPLFEPIPYDLKERIVWYLERQKAPVPLTVFLREVGLSSSYGRAVPALLNRLSPRYRDLVSFGPRKV